MAHELKPDDFSAWYNKGLSLYNLGRYEEALQAYDKALELVPDSIAWAGKVLVLGKLGRHEEADIAYKNANEKIKFSISAEKVNPNNDEHETKRPRRWTKKTCLACHGHGLEGHCFRCLGSGWID